MIDLREPHIPVPDLLADDEANAICGALVDLGRECLLNPTEHWLLSVRACNVLRFLNVGSVWALRRVTMDEIVRSKRCGATTMGEILEEAYRHGISLPEWIRALSRLQKIRSKQ